MITQVIAAAVLGPADYPVVPAGVPQAWERAQVYLGLCERYQELYQTDTGGRIAPPDGSGAGKQPPLTAPSSADRSLTATRTASISLTRSRHARLRKTGITHAERQISHVDSESSRSR